MLNTVTLIGRIATAPYIKKGETNTRNPFDVCCFIFAFNRTGISKKGTGKTQPTNYIRCYAYAGIGKIIMEHCYKGMKVFLQGELATFYYKDPKGNAYYNSQINVSKVEFMEGVKGYNTDSLKVGNKEIYLPSYGDDDFVLGDERIYEVKED